MADRRDYYEILGVDQAASAEQIRAAFRRLARERHPDRFQGTARREAEAEFQDITEAYNVLSDSNRRARYDQAVNTGGLRTQAMTPKEVGKALLAKAVSQSKAGDMRNASESFAQAVAHDPSSGRARQLYAAFLAQVHRLDEALRQIDQAAKLEPLNSKILFDASRLFAQARMYTRAARFAETAAQLEPGDATVESWLEELRGMRSDGGR